MIVRTTRRKTAAEQLEVIEKAKHNIEFYQTHMNQIKRGTGGRKKYNVFKDDIPILFNATKADIVRCLKVSINAVDNHINGSKGKIHELGYEIEEV